MIYLIGGVPRSGKSTIANALLEAGGIPYLGIDYIKMAFAKSMPEVGIDPDEDDARTAKQLWPFVEAMIHTMIENNQTYALEGVYIEPENAASLVQSHRDSIRACFVGFEEIDVNRKVRDIKAHRGVADDWLYDASDAELVSFVSDAKILSASLRSRCESLGLHYFENSNHYRRTIDGVVDYLLSNTAGTA